MSAQVVSLCEHRAAKEREVERMVEIASHVNEPGFTAGGYHFTFRVTSATFSVPGEYANPSALPCAPNG
jgi:hypothetical protein